MPGNPGFTRRQVIAAAGAAGAAALGVRSAAAAPDAPPKVYRVGVISAAIDGKPQPRNGHTWHFAQYLHPRFDWDALKRHYPQVLDGFRAVYRNPRFAFDQLPFPDTEISHYYDTDPAAAAAFAEVFPGVRVARSVEAMVKECDAVWLGDASGKGDDHFDLVAPGLALGLPTFCDKPIGGTVAGTRKILALAARHRAPLMSSSLFRHQFGMEAALRMRDAGDVGPVEHVTATLHSRYALPGWMIYGQHPVWSVMTLMGPGVEGVSMYAYKDTCHALITWPDKYPCHVWYGEPAERFEYNRVGVHFRKKVYSYTPSIEGNFEYGHHYEMFRMAGAFRRMVTTRAEPVPHREILEVTAVVHAGAKSLGERSRLVALAEVMG